MLKWHACSVQHDCHEPHCYILLPGSAPPCQHRGGFCCSSAAQLGWWPELHPDRPTSSHPPCSQELSDSCRTGAATNVIFGLALGYKSAIVPCLVIATCIFVSFTLAHMFGIACAALGFLTTLSTGEL